MKIYYAFVWISGQIPNNEIHNIENIKKNYKILSQSCDVELLFVGDDDLSFQINQHFNDVILHHVSISELVNQFAELKKFIEISLTGEPYYAFIADFLRILLMIHGLKNGADHVIYMDTDDYLLESAIDQINNIINKQTKYICINKLSVHDVNNDVIISNSEEILTDFFNYIYDRFLQLKMFDKKRMYERMSRYIFYTDLFDKYMNDNNDDEVPIIPIPISFDWDEKSDVEFLNDYITHSKCVSPYVNILNAVTGDILLSIAVNVAGPQSYFDYFENKNIEYFYSDNNLYAKDLSSEVIKNNNVFSKFNLFKIAFEQSIPNAQLQCDNSQFLLSKIISLCQM